MTPLERAARAVRDVSAPDPTGEITNPVEVVRAVLAAIREPSEAMLKASLFDLDGSETQEEIAERRFDDETTWKAMIDAALEEENASRSIKVPL